MPGMSFVADYSFARPDPKLLKAGGMSGVARYLSHQADKSMTNPEKAALLAAGLPFALVFEDGAGNALAGGGQGHADALYANQLADALGMPLTMPLYYAVDADVTSSQIAGPVLAYFAAVHAASKRPVGVYGEDAVVDGMIGRKVASYGWQTVAWSGGVHSALASLYQENVHTHPVPGVASSAYDENIVLHADWGQYPRPGVPTPAPPAPKPAPAGAYKPAQVLALQRAVHVTADTHWGPATDGALGLVRAAAYLHKIPAECEALQRAVGTTPDNDWGPKSAAALIATVRLVQSAVGAVPDAAWGAITERDFEAARAADLNH